MNHADVGVVGGRPAPLDTPSVSVIIPSYNASRTIELCLRSLAAQTNRDFETIVVDSSTDGTPQLIAERFPAVRLVRFSDRKFPGDARNFGVSQARGHILAFTDADCIAHPGWIDAILSAHAAGDPVIGGSLANGNAESRVGWAYYFCELNQWLPGTPQRHMSDIPTCCLSMKRWVFDTFGPFLEGTYCSDTAFNWKLGRAGYLPLFVPGIRVSHINVTDFRRFLKHAVMHGRHFATVRAQQPGFSPLRRRIYALLSPLIPLVLFVRAARRAAGTPGYLAQFIISSPLVMLGYVMWTCGEFLGYVRSGR